MSNTCYRKLQKYKYQLVKDFTYESTIKNYKVENHKFIALNEDGVIGIKKGYAWDGASGPTIDTENSMKASLVHDAFYQLFREGYLPQSEVKSTDQLFKTMLRDAGMSKFRSFYWYLGLRLANGKHAKRVDTNIDHTICIA
ncbi:DUF1353 domain-containing protein [Sediminitomix flava]|uniref:Uncharacterized protein DUF1353 n=1 Tax=Sediminitomix flava TaxID=379075 RepID=A0A315Z4W6_SEDFL|nr:DUF1353 domain-containing protein [Sediminitomix flava]PWJ38462.1 uncharacterized protein DUF1353 [Sediminitomix flava]